MARRVAGVLLTEEAAGARGETFEEGETLTRTQADGARQERESEDDILRKLQQLEGATDAKWNVWRTLPIEREGLVCTIATSQLELEFLQRRLGAGTYRIKGWRADGTYLKQVTLKIAEGIVDQPGTMMVNGGMPAEYLEWLSSQRGRGGEGIKQFLLAFGPLLVPVFVEMVKGWMAPRKEASLADMVGALEGLKRLSGSTPAPDPLRDIGKLRDLIGAVRDLAPESPPATGSSVWDLVRDGLKELAPLAQQALAARAQAQGTAGQSQPQQQPQPAAPQGQEQAVPDIRQILASQLPALIAKARADSNPELYAALIIDNLPPNIDLAPLVALLNDPNYFAILQGAHQGVTPYQGWFDELRKSLIEQLSEEGPADGGAADEAEEDTAPHRPQGRRAT